jgi:hypothetical protein
VAGPDSSLPATDVEDALMTAPVTVADPGGALIALFTPAAA